MDLEYFSMNRTLVAPGVLPALRLVPSGVGPDLAATLAQQHESACRCLGLPLKRELVLTDGKNQRRALAIAVHLTFDIGLVFQLFADHELVR